jgi:hypothetical protein
MTVTPALVSVATRLSTMLLAVICRPLGQPEGTPDQVEGG